jgi:hypothetical protein
VPGFAVKNLMEIDDLFEGSGRVKLDDEVVELRQWDVVRVSPEVVRAAGRWPSTPAS